MSEHRDLMAMNWTPVEMRRANLWMNRHHYTACRLLSMDPGLRVLVAVTDREDARRTFWSFVSLGKAWPRTWKLTWFWRSLLEEPSHE